MWGYHLGSVVSGVQPFLEEAFFPLVGTGEVEGVSLFESLESVGSLSVFWVAVICETCR